MNWLRQKIENIKQAFKQYLLIRRQQCLFPYGHDWEPDTPLFYMRGTGKYIDGKEIMKKEDNRWYKCKRCSKRQYWW